MKFRLMFESMVKERLVQAAAATGPVTVPLVLSLGIGISAAAGKGGSGLSGFGIVTLASLFPVLGVLLLALYVAATSDPAEIIAFAAHAATIVDTDALPWYERSPGLEVVLGIRAILPLVLFLFLILKLILRQDLPRRGEMLLGIGLTIGGMCCSVPLWRQRWNGFRALPPSRK